MTTRRVRRDATYEDLLKAPEHLVAEIVGGELITSPRPAPRHASAASVIGMDVGSAYHRGRWGPGGWWILDEPELHLGRDVLVPDVAGWRRERMPVLPAEAWFTLPPDWVCEVLSDSTRRHDRARKMPVYAHQGVSRLWLVDPLARTLEVYLLEKSRWVLHATQSEDETVRIPPFEEIELELTAVWDAQPEVAPEP